MNLEANSHTPWRATPAVSAARDVAASSAAQRAALSFNSGAHHLDMARENLPLLTSCAAVGAVFMAPALPWHYWGAATAAFFGAQRLLIAGGCRVRPRNMAGKVCVVTGASSGIGAHVACSLAGMGATVIASTRRPVAEAAKFLDGEVAPHYAGTPQQRARLMERILLKQLDLADAASIEDFAKYVRHCPAVPEGTGGGVHVLVNNAACLNNKWSRTARNVDTHVDVNFLGPVLLTERLLPLLARAADDRGDAGGRVVNVASGAHVAVKPPSDPLAFADHLLQPKKPLADYTDDDKQFYNSMRQYGLSKLLNIYHSDDVASRGVVSVAVHPGGVATNFFREQAPSIAGYMYYPLTGVMLRTPFEAAKTVTDCCVRDELVSGGYYSGGQLRAGGKSRVACDAGMRRSAMGWAARYMPKDAQLNWTLPGLRR
jgi:NAD(P)-dependent dehydrogenase (short-subunit alcohol dehydrogenase family)